MTLREEMEKAAEQGVELIAPYKLNEMSKVATIMEVDIENKLEALQAAVEGYIETLQLIPDQVVMIVNEEGLLKGLPVNPFASAVAGTTIVGNALIVGVDGEEFTDIPDKIAHQIKYKFV